MRNLLALAALLVIAFFGAGWYFDWYRLSFGRSETPGHVQVVIDINPKKISSDIKQGSDKVQEALDRAARDEPPAKTPKEEPLPKLDKASR